MSFPEYHSGDLVRVQMLDGSCGTFIVSNEPETKEDGTVLLGLIADPCDPEPIP